MKHLADGNQAAEKGFVSPSPTSASSACWEGGYPVRQGPVGPALSVPHVLHARVRPRAALWETFWN